MKQAMTPAALLTFLATACAQPQIHDGPHACTDPGDPPPLFRTALSDEFDMSLVHEGETYLDAVLIHLACSARDHDRGAITAAELSNRVRAHAPAARAFLAAYAQKIRQNGQLLETQLLIR